MTNYHLRADMKDRVVSYAHEALEKGVAAQWSWIQIRHISRGQCTDTDAVEWWSRGAYDREGRPWLAVSPELQRDQCGGCLTIQTLFSAPASCCCFEKRTPWLVTADYELLVDAADTLPYKRGRRRASLFGGCQSLSQEQKFATCQWELKRSSHCQYQVEQSLNQAKLALGCLLYPNWPNTNEK